MGTIIRYILLTASRDWLFVGLFILVLLAYGLSLFTGGTALVEQQQMVLTFFAGTSRVMLVIGLIVFVCFNIRRSFENREIEAMLSKPLSRTRFIVAYWSGFVVLSFIAAVPVMGILLTLNTPDLKGLIYWGASYFCEVALVVAFALVAALIMRSAVSAVLASFAFYILSRLMGFFVAAMNNPYSLTGGEKWSGLLEAVLKCISVIIPRLDLFAKSNWLIYGVEGQQDLWIFQVQSLVYIPLLLGLAWFDFRRKQF